jgi:tetratricopeptide (TPR) repeat protein
MSASSRASFTSAIELIGRGRLDEAEAICRAALASNADDINMLALLGALLVKQHRHAEAERCLRRAVDLAPAFAKPHEDLGILLIETRRPQEAVRFLEQAVRLDPRLESAHYQLGRALAQLGRGREADAAFEAAFALSPERKAMAHAAEHHRAGRLKEAEALYREVLSRNPDHVDALRLLGLLALEASHTDEAERRLRRAVAVAPDFTAAWLDLGRVLKELDFYAEAIDAFERAVALEPLNPVAHSLLGGALSAAGRIEEAIRAHEHALELRADHPASLIGLAHLMKTIGRTEQAISSYRRCAQVKPDNGEIYWSLANLKTYRFTDAEIAEMNARIADAQLDESSRVNFLFAVAKAWEDRGDYSRAFTHYREANTRQRALVSFDPVQMESVNERIRNVFTADFVREHAGCGNPDEAPVFILGLPRSGSTLLEQILASHSQVEGTGELPYLGRISSSLSRNRAGGMNYPESVRELSGKHFHALGTQYLDRAAVHRARHAPRFIDKMPNNFPIIGLLHLILPNARIIDARRHPIDACLSCYRQHFAKGQPFTFDLMEIGQYYLEYERLMDHWHAVVPGRVLTVQYEEVVADLEGQVRRLLDYCGLPWEDACLRFHETDRPIRTPSAEQVRQPIYDRSIGFWRHYRDELGELIEVLQPILPRYARYDRDAIASGHF